MLNGRKKKNKPTQFDVSSIGLSSHENLLLDQTKVEFFALYHQHHLQIHLFAMCVVSLLYCPKIQNPIHHGGLYVNVASKKDSSVHKAFHVSMIQERIKSNIY